MWGAMICGIANPSRVESVRRTEGDGPRGVGAERQLLVPGAGSVALARILASAARREPGLAAWADSEV